MTSSTTTSCLAVIGSAGRGLDAKSITRELYAAMYRQTVQAMRELGIRHLVSGGAAYSDHLAVLAYLNGDADRLTLRFPAPFVTDPEPMFDFSTGLQCAGIANRYHRQMESLIRVPGLSLIARAIEKGAEVSVGFGFHGRNSQVAADATALIAFTFGRPGKTSSVDVIETFLPGTHGHASSGDAGLKDGGTADTWRKAQRAETKIHVDLMAMKTALGAGALWPILGEDLNRVLFPGVSTETRPAPAAPSMGG